jgi:DNA-binding LacI/PurR family transcriptional regulator
MGQVAAKLLIKQIELGKNEKFTPETITLKTDLIIRESSKGK